MAGYGLEEKFTEDGIDLELIYGNMPYRSLTKEQAELVAQQLNDWPVEDEIYYAVEEKQ